MAGARLITANAMVLLLLESAVLLGATGDKVMSAKACPLYCLDVDYMTCKSSGDTKLNSVCNCCLAPKNCTLHLADGSETEVLFPSDQNLLPLATLLVPSIALALQRKSDGHRTEAEKTRVMPANLAQSGLTLEFAI
ncbi:unnamed protein product [Dovyalis caffra]|uniref:Uncharacterized protein n=1 Tax=Dovyalis caffra TaxID=77055 RepID=A0AAV1S1P6_9ROSI|nr:unnamed protein product [Dovyalis caffra]